VLGWANMCGNIGAAVAISLIGRMVERYGWSATFVMGSSAYLIAALGWLGVDPRTPLRQSDSRLASATVLDSD
jgi:sugar phosphate permease